jgi:hypothetical protein|tara:strand:+ start:3626 stop:3976 length:351 start_codon:yes stop_codon:yes gene_type:complete
MRNKIVELYELQLYKLLKTIEIKKKINYNILYNKVNSDLINLKTIKLEKIQDTSLLIEDKMNYLLNEVPDFIIRNKTLEKMTENFIVLCKKDSIDTHSINEDSINLMLISYIESQI